LVTSGQVASNTLKPRATASSCTALLTPWAENTSVAPGGTSARSFDEDRALGLEVVDHEGVVHDLVAHVDRRAELRSARSTISMARSTPGAKAARLGQHDPLSSVAAIRAPDQLDFESHGGRPGCG
jgi:hypothetical protein